jgi:hypothetical protein
MQKGDQYFFNWREWFKVKVKSIRKSPLSRAY